jgi:hypothetical protein
MSRKQKAHGLKSPILERGMNDTNARLDALSAASAAGFPSGLDLGSRSHKRSQQPPWLTVAHRRLGSDCPLKSALTDADRRDTLA